MKDQLNSTEGERDRLEHEENYWEEIGNWSPQKNEKNPVSVKHSSSYHLLTRNDSLQSLDKLKSSPFSSTEEFGKRVYHRQTTYWGPHA